MAGTLLASADATKTYPCCAGAHPTNWTSVKSAAFREEANFPWRQSMEGSLLNQSPKFMLVARSDSQISRFCFADAHTLADRFMDDASCGFFGV
jgi:hypothetical protein